MDYTLEICSTVSFIEQRVKKKISFKELERALGFSYRHIRKIFKEKTNVSLSHFITARKIANIAFEIVHSGKSMTEISFEYGFESYDTFTRAFKRETGMTPSVFRKSGIPCGRRTIGMGTYGPAILGVKNPKFTLPNLMEVYKMNDSLKTQGSCVLYGVPKVYYGRQLEGDTQITPFPMCFQSVLNYMGQNIHYSYLMAASGASFRLRWNVKGWDLGAVDIRNIYENPLKSFKLSFEAAGRSYKILEKENSNREEFIQLIKAEIDEGRPVIALGVVGPPEASIISGYKNDGETLLGWSLFQDNAEFAGEVSFDESGYFICENWWDKTECVMSIGEKIGTMTSTKKLLENALSVLTCEKIGAYDGKHQYYGGQAAYKAWADAISDDSSFPINALLSSLIEKMACFGDATVMVGEGRSYGAGYISWLGTVTPGIEKECNECANELKTASECVWKMNELRGGFLQNEENARTLAKKEVRTSISALIIKAQQHELKAAEILQRIVAKI